MNGNILCFHSLCYDHDLSNLLTEPLSTDMFSIQISVSVYYFLLSGLIFFLAFVSKERLPIIVLACCHRQKIQRKSYCWYNVRKPWYGSVNNSSSYFEGMIHFPWHLQYQIFLVWSSIREHSYFSMGFCCLNSYFIAFSYIKEKFKTTRMCSQQGQGILSITIGASYMFRIG
jgi:hypothetical protein